MSASLTLQGKKLALFQQDDDKFINLCEDAVNPSVSDEVVSVVFYRGINLQTAHYNRLEVVRVEQCQRHQPRIWVNNVL